jgi:hypothetical protein
MDRSMGTPIKYSSLDFLGEKAIPTDLSQWAVLDTVAG